MKLRNKKTGRVCDVAFHANFNDAKINFGVDVDADPRYLKYNSYEYHSLKELCENWGEYKSTEPLITDLYPREAVRNWLFVNGGWDGIRVKFKGKRWSKTIFVNKEGRKIEFDGTIDFTDTKVYEDRKLRFTIEELCGEEEDD